MLYGLIEMQFIWNFSEILILSGQRLIFRYHSCAFVYITVLLFRLALPCRHGLTFV